MREVEIICPQCGRREVMPEDSVKMYKACCACGHVFEMSQEEKKDKAFGPAKATDEFPTVVTVLEVLSWIVLVGGLISSVVLAGTMQTMSSYGSSYYYDYNSTSSFNFVAFIVGAVVTLIPWSFMTGLKEIVKYLHRIHSELRNLRKTEEKASGLKK